MNFPPEKIVEIESQRKAEPIKLQKCTDILPPLRCRYCFEEHADFGWKIIHDNYFCQYQEGKAHFETKLHTESARKEMIKKSGSKDTSNKFRRLDKILEYLNTSFPMISTGYTPQNTSEMYQNIPDIPLTQQSSALSMRRTPIDIFSDMSQNEPNSSMMPHSTAALTSQTPQMKSKWCQNTSPQLVGAFPFLHQTPSPARTSSSHEVFFPNDELSAVLGEMGIFRGLSVAQSMVRPAPDFVPVFNTANAANYRAMSSMTSQLKTDMQPTGMYGQPTNIAPPTSSFNFEGQEINQTIYRPLYCQNV